jgi:NAD(P)-dependent dehydrogenase (short-subunit alcohol dehydrogenase family)
MDKTVVVAGVGSGLGAALVRRFAGAGCRVAMLARSEDYLARLTKAHADFELLPLPTDISQAAEVTQAFAQVREKFGPVETLICHASTSAWKGIEDLTAEQFERAWRVTVLGAFLCCQEAARDMIARGRGAILFTGATSAIRGRAGALDFSSAKFGLRGLADSLARELWPKGIHVAHVVIDGVIGEAGTSAEKAPDEPVLDPDAIAESYWLIANQERSAWTFELDLRPNREEFFV